MDDIVIEIIEEDVHQQEAAQLFEHMDKQAITATKYCPDLSSLNFSMRDIHPETLAKMDVNSWNGVKYDRDSKRLQVSGYRTAGETVYWFYISSKVVDTEPADSIPVIIDGIEYSIKI